MALVKNDLLALAADLDQLRERVQEGARRYDDLVAGVHPSNRDSARNLAHYLALRETDVRDLQLRLAALGLSSLGRLESHVLATLDGVRRAVAALADLPAPSTAHDAVGYDDGRRALEDNATELFGNDHAERWTRIMVTLPSEAATDPSIVDGLVGAGTDVFRINCAHDDQMAWLSMIGHVRDAARRHGRTPRVAMDLAGPKLRTGPIHEGPPVRKFRPQRDFLGRTVTPAVVLLGEPDPNDPAALPLEDRSWLAGLRSADEIAFEDTRSASRTLVVRQISEGSDGEPVATCDLDDTSYLATGTELHLDRADPSAGPVGRVGQLPLAEGRHRIQEGDTIHLVPDLSPSDPMAEPITIGCALPEVFRDIREGHRVFFDDGKIGARVESVTPGRVVVRVEDAGPTGAWLRSEKGINLPDTDLDLPALTEDDRGVLPFVVAHADAVNYSFVRSADDVADLEQCLQELGRPELPIICKVETVSGFSNLPEILLTALRSPSAGVMIARGDLAVEAGYLRMGEVQEEILWLCEAAHVPVIWATEVLNTLAKKGQPSRSEVTDAAMSGRAECVMLNKGPFITRAVRFLDDLLTRMADHQQKKSALLRRLHLGEESIHLPQDV